MAIRNLGMNELGRTGLQRVDGSIYEEFLPSLRGLQGVKKYKEMAENSAVVGAVTFAIESLLRSVEWTIEPHSDAPEHLAAAQFLDECRMDMSHTWEDFISEILSMLVYGWSYFEVVYKKRIGPEEARGQRRSQFTDGRIGWRKFAIRSQDTLWKWEFDATGGIRGLWQQPPIDIMDFAEQPLVYIPIEKSMLFRTTSRKNNPEGKSLLRVAYRAYHFAKRLEEIEAIGAERDLVGLPVAFVPPEVLASDRTAEALATYNAIKDIVTRTKRDEQEGILFPLAYDENGNKLYDFILMASQGKRQFDTGGIIQRYNQHMAMSMLGDFILLGHESVGSFALSSDKTELFAVSMGAFLDTIAKTINRHAVPRLFELNTFNVGADELPKIKHGDIEQPNLTELGGYVTALTGSGFLMGPNLNLENYLRQAASLPEVSPEEFEQKQLEAEQQQLMGQAVAGAGLGVNTQKDGPSSPPRPASNVTNLRAV